MISSITGSGPLVPSLECLRDSSLNISQAHLIAPNPNTPGSLLLPWESPRDLAPASEFATPGHFLAKTLSLEFVQHSRDLLEEFLLKDEGVIQDAIPVENVTSPLVRLLQALTKMSEIYLNSLIAALGHWKATTQQKPVAPEQSKKIVESLRFGGSKTTEAQLMSLMDEKKQIFVEYLYAQTVIHLLKHQKDLSQLSEINAIKLEETAVDYIKSSDEAKPIDSQTPTNKSYIKDIWSRILGVISRLRLNSILNRFLLDVKDVTKNPAVVATMMYGIRYIQFDLTAGTIKASTQFVDLLNKNIKAWMKRGEHRLAIAEATGFILNSTVGLTPPPGTDGDEWKTKVTALWVNVLALAKKVKKSWQIVPLQIVLLCMQQEKIFTIYCETLVNSLLEMLRDPAMRQLALESLYRVLFAYFHKFNANTQSIQHTKFLFASLTQNLYPTKTKPFVPSRSCIDTFVDIIDLLAMKHYETVIKNFINEYIIVRDPPNPEPVITGLISFMGVSNRHRLLKSPETESLLVGNVTANKSVGYYRFRKESLFVIGGKEAPKYASFTTDLAQLNTALLPAYHLADTHVGEFSKIKPQKGQLEMILRDKVYFVDLLRCFLYACRRTIPIGISSLDFLAIVCKYTLHIYDGIVDETFQLLTYLMETRPPLRGGIISQLCRVVADIPDSHIALSRGIVTKIIGLMKRWRGILNKTVLVTEEQTAPCEKIEKTEFVPHEVEGIALVLLCHTDQQARRLGLELLKYVSVFSEALGGFNSTRVYSIVSNNSLELINRAHEFRASIQQKPLSPSRRKDDSVEAFLARRQVREDDFLWARLLGHLANRSSVTCRDATSHAWRILTARLTTLFPLIESGKDITEERLNAWRNYVCFGVAACVTEDTKQIPTVPEGTKDVLSAIHSSRDLYRVIVLFLGSENKNQNEPVETAVTFVFPGSFPMLAKEFQQSEAIAYPEGEKHAKQRKKGQLRLMTSLSYVYRVAIENCQKGSLSEPFYNLLFKEFFRVLEMQVNKFPAVLPGDNPVDVYFLRYNINCLLTRLVQEANNGSTDKKKTLTEKGMNASLLFQYAMDCSTCGPNSAEIYEAEDPLIAAYLASNPEFKEDVAQVRLSATRALAELLTTPLADKEESIVFIYHDNLFRKGIPDMQLEGEKGLINIVKSNPGKIEKYSKEYLLRCYADRMILAGYFQALTEMIIEGTTTSTSLPAALQLALYKLGDPREEIRNTASRLIHAICRIHYNSAYYPVETNTQTYNTYQTSQVLVSCNFARDHAEITLEFFDECLARLRLIDVLARDRLLRYLNPWLKNIKILANQTSILDRLVVVTVKYGELYSNTVRNLWLTISSIPGNLEVVLNYLVQKAVDDKNVALIYMAQKIAVILFSGHPQRTVDFLMERIQISDFTTDTIEDSVAFQSKNPVTPQEAFSAVMANPLAAEQWEIEHILPFCSQEVTFSTTNIAVFMLCDLLSQNKSDKFVGHLPVLLQIGVLGLDDPSLLVADFSKTLLANVTFCLAAQTPASAEAYTLATELSNAAKNNKRYWRHENATTDHFILDSAVRLGVLVKRLTSVLAEQTNITEKWSTESLRWITECSSPHTVSRSLQIYRTLNEPVSQAGLTAIISCLYKHLGARTNEVTLGVEVLLTLDVLIESTKTVDALRYPQLFWTTVAYLHSDHQAEFLMALDLLRKMIEKYNFANDSNVSDVLLADEVVPKNWGDATFQGVQPLLLRGLMSEVTAPKTIALLIELSPLLASHQVFCVDQAVGAIDNILGLLPWLLFNFGSKETVNYASSLAISLQTLGYSDLAVCYHRYTQSEFSTNNEFLIALFADFKPFHPKHYLRIFAILNEMLEEGPPKYQRTVLQILGSYVMSSGITASDIRKKIMSVFLHISNRLSGPLWDEVLPILDTTLALHGSTLNSFPLTEDPSPYDLSSMKPSATWKDNQSKKRLTASTQQILETMNFSVSPLAVGQVPIDEDDVEPAVSFHRCSTSSSVLPFDWAAKKDTIRVFIPTFETWGNQQKFSVYKVVVQSGGVRWKACRRYNEFHQLHDQLALEFNPLPKMPPKKIIGNNLSLKFVEGRRAKLEDYLMKVVKNFPTIFNNKYFQGFCDVINPKSPSLGVFSSIPEIILLKIFGYLSLRDLGFAVVATCKYWQRMGEDDTLWNEITLSTFTLKHPLACETWKLQYKECKAKPPTSRPGPAGGPTGPKVNLTPVQLRQETIDEIVSTERDYVTILDTCISVFLMPLRALRLLSEVEIQKLFSNIEVIANVNREVLKDMDQLIGKIEDLNSPTAIGTIFGKMSAFFKTYAVYCSNQPTAIATYTVLERNPQFKNFMDVCHSDARCKGVKLFGFLIKPVQRICQYPLLLRELLKHTPDDHPDYLSVDLAKCKIDEVTESINEYKRSFEQLQKMVEIQELVEGSEIIGGNNLRRLLKEGVLNQHVNGSKPQERILYLFTDLVVVAKPTAGKKYECKGQVALEECRLINTADTSSIKHAFELHHKKDKYVFLCSGEEEKKSWLRQIQMCIRGFQIKRIKKMNEAKKS